MEKVRASLKLRDAKPEDARVLAEIHVAAWRAAYRGLMPEAFLAALKVEDRIEMWQRTIGRAGPAKLALAALDSRVVGFCLFGPTRDEAPRDVAEIYALYVQPGKWRQGWGRALCEHAEREAAVREHNSMTLWVMKDNEPARCFYERLGYRTDGAERADTKLTGTPFDEVRYIKVIG